jgi:two-component system cell cycle response regulator
LACGVGFPFAISSSICRNSVTICSGLYFLIGIPASLQSEFSLTPAGTLLASKEAKEDIVTGLESGADDYLIKPFDTAELKARLRTGMRILNLENRLVEAREEMRFKTSHDALTTVWNRGIILELLGRQLSRSHRENATTVIILCDIDHFKGVNDSFGHLVGEEVLRETAKRLLASVRSYDFVGRYGGEEFLVVLNNCDPAFALARAEEIRNTIAQRPVQTSTGPVPLTISLGMLLRADCTT